MDVAGSGDVICVAAGNYTENVVITTPHLTLEGAGANVVTVTAANSGDPAFYVLADYVNISGFTATGTHTYNYGGIHLEGVRHCNISENNAAGNIIGILLVDSSDNTLTSNTANSNNNYGIYLYESSNNLIYNNYWSNTNNAYDDGNNTWNITKTDGPNIIDCQYLGGNYWGDYAGSDTDGDGQPPCFRTTPLAT